MNRGFTLIELLVSIAIFVIMTALVVAKYGNFNSSTLLTDTAYDIALTLRTAQSYGMSVKNVDLGSSNFNSPYGIDFDSSSAGHQCGVSNPSAVFSNNKQIVLFADKSNDYKCDSSSDAAVNTSVITRGAFISNLCAGTDGTSCNTAPLTILDVTYLRPDPDAHICDNSGSTPLCGYNYGQITIQGTDGSTRTISVRQNGQISVNQ